VQVTALKQEIARKKRDIEALLENAPDMCEEVCELDELLISLFDLNLMSVIGMYYSYFRTLSDEIFG